MAMLGMQTDMQCGYLPACYSSWDLNINASCSTWPLNNVNKIFKNGHNHNCGLTPPSPDQHFAYKELLKQKMLQHEAIFRDQVCSVPNFGENYGILILMYFDNNISFCKWISIR